MIDDCFVGVPTKKTNKDESIANSSWLKTASNMNE